VGFFVYRHLGLLICNIGYMKRFLPLLMLTGFFVCGRMGRFGY